MEHEHEYTAEPTVEHHHHYHEPTAAKAEGDTMSGFTNPALPLVANGGFGGRGRGRGGFKPADAALVQSNNLAIIASQLSMQIQMASNQAADNSKDNALLAKDNALAIANMQNNMTMLFMQMQSKLDHIACCACQPAPMPARG